MSKVSFRARALDATKPMPVYKATEIPDMKDFAQINRSVPQMPTGMEKEEETEHHLQRALSAQQVYGSSEALVIPIPEVQDIAGRYDELYPENFKPTKQYIHIQAFCMDQEIPDYDMDSEDDEWLCDQKKKMEITPIKFEEMMDRLEKGSGQQVVTLQEAKLLLKEDDDLIIAVYDYWLNKRLKMQRPLTAAVKSDKRDGTTTNNPYVAFRRRTEKMQTRKNRKNDEVSYEKMLKLRRDLQKTLTLVELLKRREKSKKELLQLTIEVMEKRFEIEDFSGAALAEAEEERDKHPTFVAPFALNSRGEWVQTFKGEEAAPVRKKRQYRKRKQQQQQTNQLVPPLASQTFPQQQHSSGEVDVMDSSDDDMLSPVSALSQSDHEDENDPDGMFAFKRRKNCHYHQPLHTEQGNWPWCGPDEGGRGDKRFRYSLTSLPSGCIGYARRRVGRGGRILFDRASTPWDDTLEKVDFNSPHQSSVRSISSDYVTYIRESKIPHYRPKTPPTTPEDDRSSPGRPTYTGIPGGDFDVETFQCHQEELLEQQREQLSQPPPLSTLIGDNGGHPPGLTLDSASAEFAVRALVDTPLPPPSGKLASHLKHQTQTSSLSHIVVSKGKDTVVGSNNGKTISNTTIHVAATQPSSKHKLPTISSNSLLSPAISLLHKSATPVLPQLNTSTNHTSSHPSSNHSMPHSSTAKITLSHSVKSNGPLSSATHVKSSSGLSTLPAANVLQLNFPVSTSLPSSSSPTVVKASTPTPATSVSASSSIQLQRSINSKHTSSSTLYKMPVTAANTANFEMLRPNHEESTVIRFNKDTGIPMDVT